MCDHFQMIWIATQAIIAQMVYLFLGGYIPKIMGKYDNMDSYRRVIEAHATIAPASAITGGWPLPDVARARNSIYLITEVDNTEARFDLGEDVLASLVEHFSEAPSDQGSQRKRCSSGRSPR